MWGVDNFATAYLNGTEIASIAFGFPAFQSLAAYSDAGATFDAGWNYLTFVVSNTGEYNSGNPAAFRATVNVTAAVPLPAGLPLLGGGIALLGLVAARRRRNASV